jgi:hypothetical protein
MRAESGTTVANTGAPTDEPAASHPAAPGTRHVVTAPVRPEEQEAPGQPVGGLATEPPKPKARRPKKKSTE